MKTHGWMDGWAASWAVGRARRPFAIQNSRQIFRISVRMHQVYVVVRKHLQALLSCCCCAWSLHVDHRTPAAAKQKAASWQTIDVLGAGRAHHFFDKLFAGCCVADLDFWRFGTGDYGSRFALSTSGGSCGGLIILLHVPNGTRSGWNQGARGQNILKYRTGIIMLDAGAQYCRNQDAFWGEM